MDKFIEAAAHFVKDIFAQCEDKTFAFHNYDHTQKVTARVEEICGQEAVPAPEQFIVITAAWFHDTGYLFVPPLHHEEESVKIMSAFCADKNIEPSVIEQIASCILATKFPTHPQNKLQQIICDADTYHFGTPEFLRSNEKVFEEFQMRFGLKDKNAFIESAVSLLKGHQFYTDYCKRSLAKGKHQNILMLIDVLR